MTESTTLTSDTTTTTTTTLDPAQITTIQTYEVTQTIDVTSSTTATEYTTVTPTPTVLLVNGDFSTGQLSPWYASIGWGGDPVSFGVGPDPRGSGYSYIFTPGPGAQPFGNIVYLSQDLQLVAGATYTLTFDYMVLANPAGNIWCNIQSGGTTVYLTEHITGSYIMSPPNTWVSTSDTFTAPDAAATLSCSLQSASGTTFYLDDFVLTQN